LLGFFTSHAVVLQRGFFLVQENRNDAVFVEIGSHCFAGSMGDERSGPTSGKTG
jgi:hypothetical protein